MSNNKPHHTPLGYSKNWMKITQDHKQTFGKDDTETFSSFTRILSNEPEPEVVSVKTTTGDNHSQNIVYDYHETELERHRNFEHNHNSDAFIQKFAFSLNSPKLPPYTPLTRYFYLSELNHILNDSIKAEFLRSGLGLERFISAEGEVSLKENGVVYKTWNSTKDTDKTYDSRSYRPFIPFNEEIFFEGDINKMASYHVIEDLDFGAEENGKKIILKWQDKWYSQPIPGLQVTKIIF